MVGVKTTTSATPWAQIGAMSSRFMLHYPAGIMPIPREAARNPCKWVAERDAGSVPAASTFGSTTRVLGMCSGNDSEIRTFSLRARERLHVALQVAEIAMAVDAERGGKF
jgi:hypothetical protein